MASSLPNLVESFQGTRLTYTSSHSFEEVVARLRRQTNPHNEPLSQPAKPHKPYTEMTEAEFIEFINSRRGPSGFMYFHELDFGSWANLLSSRGGTRMKKFLVGNPLVAITILKHDERAALSVPIELLIRELDNERGVEIVYLKPEPVPAPHSADRCLEIEGSFLALERMISEMVKNIAL